MRLFTNKLLIIIFQLIFVSQFFSANLTIKRGNQTLKISSENIRGTEYVSSKELAKALGANFYFNPNRQKSEIKFVEYNLKYTANNQFVILTSKKDNKHQIFQMPVSAKLISGSVMIPIKYSAEYLGLASGFETSYIENGNTLLINPTEINTREVVAWNKNLVDRSTVKYDIFSAKIENKTNGTLLRLATKNEIRVPTSSINGNTLYLFFSNVTIDKNLFNSLQTKGFIRNIQIKHVNGNPQMEISLREGYDKYEVFYDEDIGEILVSIHNKFLKSESNLNEEIEKWKFDTIVIDAGHGGKDPGAIGINGIREKDITLAIALELGSLIKNKMKDVKVVYTRDKDVFPELYKRGQIANENRGDLFISIHCNATPKKPTSASGIEVYLLRPGRTKEAIDIAEFENSVIRLEDDPQRYKKLTDENFILVSMANTSNLRYSETFADMLNTEWIKDLGIPSRGIKQAGFYVLVGASMPSVLIETGFISNKNDAKYLNSRSGQKEIANSILNAIFKYKNYYESIIASEIKN
ncbi:MAG: N-acetylmuramoyl-L-alanine amidase [Ignavibacteriales bacterium]|nr:N-acetylmuramoyl-L-alanine amidase [Ignavibacteriales bacterium]MCB9258629.1 N-acetylmuramoyl-L-alanine amidase [Ignavibacteriales bacterium]